MRPTFSGILMCASAPFGHTLDVEEPAEVLAAPPSPPGPHRRRLQSGSRAPHAFPDATYGEMIARGWRALVIFEDLDIVWASGERRYVPVWLAPPHPLIRSRGLLLMTDCPAVASAEAAHWLTSNLHNTYQVLAP